MARTAWEAVDVNATAGIVIVPAASVVIFGAGDLTGHLAMSLLTLVGT